MTRLSLFHRSNTRPTRRAFRPRIDLLEDRKLLTAGTLDTTFGGTGMVTTMIQKASGSDSVAVQSDLRVVVAGLSNNGAYPNHFTIVRYNADGSLDSTFGNGAVVIIPLSTINDLAYSVAIQPADGKILVGGRDVVAGKKGQSTGEWCARPSQHQWHPGYDLCAGKGYVLTSFAQSVGYGVTALAVQSNGQIVAAGDAPGGIGLVRYNADGSLDTSFGNGGEVVNTGIQEQWGGQMVAIDSSGDIDVVGSATVGTASEMAVARYLANGTLDTSFGISGVVHILPADASSALARSVGLQSTGEIVVYGQGNYGTSQTHLEPTLARLNTDGSLDTTFGSSGFYGESRMQQGISMVIESNDEIIAVGNGRPNGTYDGNWWVTEVLANGSSYDPNFGTNGLAEANFNNSQQMTGVHCTLAPDGKIVLTGGVSSGGFAAARFLGDTSSPSISLASSSIPSTANPLDSTPLLVALDESLFFAPANRRNQQTTRS